MQLLPCLPEREGGDAEVGEPRMDGWKQNAGASDGLTHSRERKRKRGGGGGALSELSTHGLALALALDLARRSIRSFQQTRRVRCWCATCPLAFCVSRCRSPTQLLTRLWIILSVGAALWILFCFLLFLAAATCVRASDEMRL